MEWNLTGASDEERAELARWIALYKHHRSLLHSGTVLRVDHPDPALWVHGVVARDAGEALVALVAVATGPTVGSGTVRVPGLEPDAAYLVRQVTVTRPPEQGHTQPAWLGETGVVLTGRTLAVAGLPAPILAPEHMVLVHLLRADRLTEAGEEEGQADGV